MDENEECKNFEEVMVNRLMKLTNAMDEENGDDFDRVSGTLELWMKTNIPQIYENLMEQKTPLDQATESALSIIPEEAKVITDTFAREAYIKKEMYNTVWDYRSKYFELVLGIVSRNGYIPYSMGNHAEMKSIHETEH